MSSAGAVFVEPVGMFVGWLLITYGLILWGRQTPDKLGTHSFIFVTAGIALLLAANDPLVGSDVASDALEAIAYVVFAVIGTAVFAHELDAVNVELDDAITDGGPNSDGDSAEPNDTDSVEGERDGALSASRDGRER